MEFLVTHAEHISAVIGAFVAAWGLIRRVDKSHRKHLSAHFAGKQEFLDVRDSVNRIEDKLDELTNNKGRASGRRNFQPAARAVSSRSRRETDD